MCGARVKHAVTRLDSRTHKNGCWTLEYALCCFVIVIPGLNPIAEDLRYIFKVHFPCGIESCVVDGSQKTDCWRKMARVANWAVE